MCYSYHKAAITTVHHFGDDLFRVMYIVGFFVQHSDK